MTEVWRDLPEMPDYQVSDLGRIRSIDRQIEMKSRWGGMCAKLQRGRVLTPFRAGNLEWCTPSENMLHSTYVLGNTRGQFASASG